MRWPCPTCGGDGRLPESTDEGRLVSHPCGDCAGMGNVDLPTRTRLLDAARTARLAAAAVIADHRRLYGGP